MKQYLHTIMRSLCIMLMLCGISTSAWAQSFSSGSGEEDNPYIISSEDEWNEFLNYNSDGYYFKLGENIELTTAPTESVTINCNFNNDDNYTISVGSEDTPASVDDFSLLTALFDDSSWESIVTYYYYVTNSNWNSFVSSYSSLSSNGTTSFILGESIEFSSSNLPESSLSVSESDFSMGDYTITVGGESDAVEFSSSFTHVFDNEFDSNVTYYFYTDGSNWDDFVSYYNDLSDKSKVYLVMTDNVELTSTPSNALVIASDNFINSGDYKFSFSDGITPSDVFLDSDMNAAYVEGGASPIEIYDLTTWQGFLTAYNNGEVDSEATVTITGEVIIEYTDDLPSSSIDLDNITFDGGSITVNIPLEDQLYTVFSNSEVESNVTYNYTVTDEYWDTFVGIIPSESEAEHIKFVISDAISLSDSNTFPTESISYSGISFNGGSITVGEDGSPITFSEDYVPLFTESELESQVQYYFSLTTDNWDAFTSNYSNFTENDNVSFSLESDVVLPTPTATLEITSTYLTLDVNYTLSVGSEESYEDLPETFKHVFSDTDLEAQVKYYYNVTEWDYFTSNFDDLNNNKVYTKLGTDATINAGFEQITEFKGHFDGNSSDEWSITMPDCNINNLSTLFSEEIPEENVTNVLYAYGNLNITDAAGLEVLRSKADDWYSNICQNYTIDLTNGDIELGEDWTPINNSDITLNISCPEEGEEGHKKPIHHIIFPSVSVSELYSVEKGHILTSETYSDINKCYQYSEISFSSTDEVGYLSGDISAVCDACTKWKLTDDIDYSSSDIPSSITIHGTFDSGDYHILMPYFNASDYPDKLPKIFTGVDGVNYKYSEIYIESDDDLATFISHQAAMKELSTYVTINANVNINAKDWVPLDDDFDITFTNYIYATIDSQSGLNKIAGDLSTLSGSNYISVYPNNTDNKDKWYDYDMTSIDLGESFSTITLHNTLDSPITILLKDNQDYKPFDRSGSDDEKYLNYFYTPSFELVDVLFNGALSDTSKRTSVFDTYAFDSSNNALNCGITEYAGHGTVVYPYQIYSYEMLEELIKKINDGLNTEGMYITLASDINMQGNERLTGIDGTITLSDYKTSTLQFPAGFKGSFNGGGHSIGGLTRPLFSSLESGATITNLGIVDCFIEDASALIKGDCNATISNCYVSGVSDGLIPESASADNCYAFNPKKYADNNCTGLVDENDASGAFIAYNFSSTTEDASGTHCILSGNCYPLGSKYSDCTLFIPKDNTIYTVSPNEFFTRESADDSSDNYMNYIKWGSFCWIENPLKSNASLLHNVKYNDYWLNNSTEDLNSLGNRGNLDYLYSWYIVDKKTCSIPGEDMRVNNIYYSRNAKDDTAAPAGLNTIYMPFAWDPANDLYVGSSKVSGAKVYLLADKLDDDKNFDDYYSFTDYTQESELKFFQPSNKNYALVSNALPTILDAPSAGWYIKRSGIANYYVSCGDEGYEASLYGGKSEELLPNLYDRYWNDDTTDRKNGRSFMDIDRLDTENHGRAFHCGTFKLIGAGNDEKTFAPGTYSDYACYKLASKQGGGYGMASVTASSTVQPFRTFIAIAPGSDASGAKASYSFGFCGIADIENTTTYIEGVPVEGIHLMTTDESRVYSLDGRYIGQYGQKKFAPGIYIMNGKKFVVK